MSQRQPKNHTIAEFGLDVFSGDLDLFRWFLLCYLFGKPIRAETAIKTWQLFVEHKMDTPWAIRDVNWRELSDILCDGGYRRYDTITAHGLQKCTERLIREYEGSLTLLIESSVDQNECAKRLQKLHGVGPKVAEIFMMEVEEMFARRIE
ncbi:MAG TPA: DNA methylase [Candidatus Saccharibacteria bacterium]|nr:DNA methylase [Candidatus Saccharibacteria bacterium]